MRKLLIFVVLVCFEQTKAQIITTIAGSSVHGFSGDGGPIVNAKLYGPAGITFDTKGNFYFPDMQNNRVRKVYPSGIITTVAGDGYTCCSLGDSGLATSAELYFPGPVAFDAVGNMYIPDQWHQRIRKVDTSGIITTVAGNGYSPSTGQGAFSGDGGMADAAELNVPTSICFDAIGNLYIADADNNRIRKVDNSGIITTIAGGASAGYSGDGGPATSALLNIPSDIAFDGAGNLYIADAGNNVVRMIDSTGIISTVAGTGTGGYSGDGGPAITAQLYLPAGITLDGLGNLYIADERNNRVRKVDTSGIITTIAGTGTGAPNSGAFSGDGGSPLLAELYDPAEIAIDAAGFIYIVDASNNRIRRIDTCNSLSAVSFSITPNATPHVWDIYPVYSSNVTNAKWYWGDDSTSMGLYPSHTYDSAGWYNVCVTVYNPCGDTTGSCQNDSLFRIYYDPANTMVQINVVNGTSGSMPFASRGESISIYPNPSRNSIMVVAETELGAISIYNCIGETVLQTKNKNTREQIDISKLPAGIYTLNVQGSYKKFVKE